jgi:bacterioferritin-associated ferredoxin
MIVCSCNVFSDHEVRSAVAKITRPRLSQIYAAFGGRPRCGRCARTIKAIVEDINRRGQLYCCERQPTH